MNFSNKKINYQYIKDLFCFPKGDRKILFYFCLAILLFITGEVLYNKLQPSGETYKLTQAEKEKYLQYIREQETAPQNTRPHQKYEPDTPVKLQYFDPNTADRNLLAQTGMSHRQISNLIKYREKGGRFRHADDLAKIYGMTPELMAQLKPWIRITPDTQPSARKQTVPRNHRPEKQVLSYPRNEKFQSLQKINLNTCDTSLLKRIPGIGSYYARSIIQYRKRLGGFVCLEQLKEIASLPQNIEEWFYLETSSPEKLQINKLSFSELKKHPYLNTKQCRVILEHRRKYGPLHHLKDLSLYEDFNTDDLQRLEPYITFTP